MPHGLLARGVVVVVPAGVLVVELPPLVLMGLLPVNPREIHLHSQAGLILVHLMVAQLCRAEFQRYKHSSKLNKFCRCL